ncbi:5-(carboxyamino)imidazole ribonucleotide synthase [Aquifex aeolicus]|uniref:N5-carboxyaminoimidazole ribonucleotide synthase n=1 Tax=Aquifex aeolicus (strain VF5) TaxID=224324 RepID=PURK_AQUAE|nr:5-(carboxyamino)imidazole ribonucleotide synthase [Aquifex aeolicus]O66608.1 RecName: Full=N5-carboxyaminoimidazole ribonucleotide synthase; Short=N5-CAIR synthase; AltName: Full=5-(carboxyamino)imidazole ribonucleotide synthetase [Aquifex aeolicus VF5]AAC06567.1 phosphoribosyl aminoimidazole carboxylase [Aquifex aeolicus VF5]
MLTVGILGGGQLGWMTILEGRKLGFKFHVLEDKENAPACRVADRCFRTGQISEFVDSCDIITYEFEHIKDEVLEKCESKLIPNPQALYVKKSRIREKLFLKKHGFPVPEFLVIKRDEIIDALKSFKLPVVIKAEKLGYDGKGQYRIKKLEDANQVVKNHDKEESFIIEEFVKFEAEISCIGVRDREGKTYFYPQPFNKHEEGILIYNYVPYAKLKEAEEITKRLMELLDIVGVFTVEFFLLKDGRVLINEFAPRVHNTGHWTLDGAYTSQFENLLRAITEMPLGSTELKLPSGMVNILGKSYEEIPLKEILSVEGAKLYWYGKEKKPRRKVGHVNVVGRSKEEVVEKVERVFTLLKGSREKLPAP